MKGRGGIIGGLALILVGAALVADQLGYTEALQNWGWSVVAGVVGLAFLILALNRQGRWWPLLIACFSLSLAVFIYIVSNELLPEEIAGGGFLFFGLALPFWLIPAYRGREAWWATIPAAVMTMVALGVGLEPLTGGDVTGALVLFGIAAPFWIIFFLDRQRWWAMIPATVMTFIALGVGLGPWLGGDVTGGLVLLGVAAPFWIVFARDRQQWWATIPAAILTFIALGVGLESLIGGEGTGATVLWGIAAPFWLLFILDRTRWWAIIPAGVMTTLGFTPLLGDGSSPQAAVALIFGGVGATFLLVYLLSGRRREMIWALWAGAGCLAGAALVLVIGPLYRFVGAILLVVGGLALLALTLFRRR